MAAEIAQPPINGHYQAQPYGGSDAYGSVQAPQIPQAAAPSQPANAPTSNATNASSESNDITKDEVGWYFVEQYYTTLSRSPEKLHLFYSKRSQFVNGVEAEKVSVSVGQKAISDRIKALDIQDCKVRVLNVDSQASFQNIVVQVIGEISNKSAPHRKFVQTFVLAEQPNGYFVLNDIFRYLLDEEDEDLGQEEAEPSSVDATTSQDNQEHVEVPEEEALAVAEPAENVAEEIRPDAVDAKLEETAKEEVPTPEEPSEIPKANGTPEEAEEPAAPTTEETTPAADLSGEETKDTPVELEKPKEPEPTLALSPPKAVTPTPTPEVAPAPTPVPKAAPKTWANLVAANRAPPPAVPTSTSPAPQQKPATPVAQSQTPPSGPAETTKAPASSGNGSEWQSVGDHGKRQGRPQAATTSEPQGIVLAYIKNVNERVDAALLKETLAKYGKIAYFDVSRQKSCAFVEFANPAGYNAAVAANPHQIGSEQIFVEERRPRPNAFGGSGSYGARGGGIGGRGRGGPDNRSSSQGRGGFQKEAGRGTGYTARGGGGGGRGTGGNVTPKGRGQAQAA